MQTIAPPNFFVQWLNNLKGDQLQHMYLWVAENDRTNATDAIMDIVAPMATAEPE